MNTPVHYTVFDYNFDCLDNAGKKNKCCKKYKKKGKFNCNNCPRL